MIKPLPLSVLALAAFLAPATLTAKPVNMMYQGAHRTLLLERPPVNEPRPTVIILHGAGGNALAMSRITRMGELGRREGFVTVFVNGLGHIWNDGRPEHTRFAESRGLQLTDDAGFLRALIGELVKRRIADPKRIYLTGFSNGGEMTYRMVCDHADLFAAVGTMSALMPASLGAKCRPSVPMPIVVMSGTADRTMPFNGGPLGNGQGSVWSAQETAAFFRRLDDCAGPGEQIGLSKHNPSDPTHVTEFRWSDCKAGAVILYRIEGGGHAVPGAEPPNAAAGNAGLRGGMRRQRPGVTTELNAAQALWSFFQNKQR